MERFEWICCPVCGGKTRDRIREDTILKNYPLFCPKFNVAFSISTERLLNIVFLVVLYEVERG